MIRTLKISPGLTILALLSFFLLGTQVANASSVIRTADKVSIAGDQLIEADFYSAAGKVNLSGEITGDALVLSSQITVNGKIAKDATLVGGTVDVYGTVGDDLRIVAGEVTIAEPVMGDVMVVGGMVNILSSASVSGDVILFAGQATIEGSVGGDVLGWSDSLRIDAPVAGDVSITVNQLTLGDKAHVTGSVQYVSRDLAVQAQGATIEGDLVRNDPVVAATETTLRSALLPILVILFSVLSWYLISRRSLTRLTNKALSRNYRPAVYGFAAIVLVPFAVIMLSVSVIGSLVGITMFFFYALLLMLGLIAIPALLGQSLMKVLSQPTRQLSLLTLVIGVIGMVLLAALPFIGLFVLLGVLVLAVGAMIDLLIHFHSR